MMCQCRFIDCNKYSSLMRDHNSWKAMHVEEQGVFKNSVPPAQFCWEPQTALKNKVLSFLFFFFNELLHQFIELWICHLVLFNLRLKTFTFKLWPCLFLPKQVYLQFYKKCRNIFLESWYQNYSSLSPFVSIT